MSFEYKELVKAQLTGSDAQVGGAVPAGHKWYIRGILLFNGGSTNQTVKLFNGSTSGPDKVFEATIQPKETYEVNPAFSWVVDDGDALAGSATTTATVSIRVLGAERPDPV